MASSGEGLLVVTIARHWPLVETDFQQVYGIDLSDGCLTARRWRWLELRMIGLLSTESRIQRVLNPATPANEATHHGPVPDFD